MSDKIKKASVMNEKEQRLKYIKERMEALPSEVQRAIGWIIENIDLVNEMSQGEKLTKEEIAMLTQMALDKNDYILLAIVLYKQNKDQAETETKQQENR